MVIPWIGLALRRLPVLIGLFAGGDMASAAAAEIVLQRGPQVEVSAAVYSPDGHLIASAGESETIRLWDRESGDLVRILPGHPERIVGLAYSPDGKLLASSSTDGRVKVWDVREGQLVHLFTNHVGNWVRRVAFSPDGRWLVPASYDGKVSVWDVASGNVVRTLATKGRVADVLFTPDGHFIVTASREDKSPLIQFWDAATGKPGLVLDHSNRLSNIAVSREGKLLASGGDKGAVNLWELPSGRLARRVVTPEKDEIFDIDLNGDGRWLATAGQWVDRVWATDSGAMLCVMHGHEDSTIQISFSPDGREVATGSSDASIRLWNSRSGKLRRILAARPPDSPVTCIAFSPDGAFEAVGGVDGVVRVWDARSGGFKYELRGHEGAVYALAFSLDSSWLCSGGADRTMRVWDMGHGTISAVHPYFNRVDAIGAIAFGGRERLVASASGPWGRASLDHDIKLWSTHYERPIRTLRGHVASVRSIAFTPHADLLASASLDGTVKVWNSRRGECLSTLTNEVLIEVIAFTPGGQAIVAGMANGMVCVLDKNALTVSRQWRAHRRPVQSLALSSDGRWLATASADQTVVVWDWESGGEMRRFTNVTSQYLPLSFHPKQPVLAFAQRDEMVVHANVESSNVQFRRVLFPDGEWLAWNPDKAFYAASPRGHEHARVRFANQLHPVYPLEFYRAALNHQTNLLAALDGPAPVIAPKNLRLRWHRYPYKQAWLYATLTVALGWVAVRLRRGWIAERRRRAQESISRQLLISQEAERKRIAAELHDSLGQNLLIIKNRLYLAQQKADGDARAAELRDISQTVSQTIEEVREISHNLRPYQLDRLGLTKAVQFVLKKAAASGSLRLESEVANIDGLFSPEGEINFYRIVQECLNNILKHSDAATARVTIQRTDGRLTMNIADDGRGFAYPQAMRDEDRPRGFGLTGLNERVRILGGHFECDSAPGQGTRLTFKIPIPTKHEKGNQDSDGG